MPTVWPFTDPAPLRDVPGSRLRTAQWPKSSVNAISHVRDFHEGLPGDLLIRERESARTIHQLGLVGFSAVGRGGQKDTSGADVLSVVAQRGMEFEVIPV